MKTYNPMNLFDNSKPMFNSIKGKQQEYLGLSKRISEVRRELTTRWDERIKKNMQRKFNRMKNELQ